MKTKFAAVGAVAVLGLLSAYVWWPTETIDFVPAESSSPVASMAGQGTPPTTDPMVAATDVDAASRGAISRTEVAATTPAIVDSRLAVFRGRCVDVDGQPLAGVMVQVHGFPGNQHRMEVYRRDHDKFEYEDPEQQMTGANGEFEISFAPIPPYQFVLDLVRDGFVEVGGRWGEIAAGTVKDFGDIVLAAGVLISGQVVDPMNRPVTPPNKSIRISLTRDFGLSQFLRREHPRSEIRPRGRASGIVQPDGSFALRGRIMPGVWYLRLGRWDLVPIDRKVTIKSPPTDLRVVVKQRDKAPAIRGIIVDTDGRPVRDAWIRTSCDSTGSSGRDGRFVLFKPPNIDARAKISLTVDSRSSEPLETGRDYAWGDEAVRLVVPSGIILAVHVVRKSDGTAVEDFGVRILPVDSNRSSGADRMLRGGWKHEGGVLRIDSLQRRRWAIYVEPVGKTGLAPSSRIVEVRGDRAQQCVFALAAAIEQVVRVRDGDGSSIAGSRVELIEASGDEIDTDSYIRQFNTGAHSTAEKGLLIDSSETEADGQAVVRGAPEHRYVIRCLGDHPPVIRHDVTLSADPIEIIVPGGATLRVVARSESILADWREQAGVPRRGELSPSNARLVPRLYLRRFTMTGYKRFPVDRKDAVPIDEEGVTEIAGIPDGTWNLLMTRSVSSAGRIVDKELVVRRELRLHEGQIEIINLDLASLVSAKLRGVVFVDGKPHRGSVFLRRERGSSMEWQVNGQSNAEGVFEVEVQAGRWHVTAHVRVSEHRWIQVPVGPPVRTAAGEPAEARFEATLARARIKVVDDNGQALKGVSVTLVQGDHSSNAIQVAATDSLGHGEIVGPPGTYQARIRIRSLTSSTDYQRWYAKNQAQHNHDTAAANKAASSSAVALRDITLIAGAGNDRIVIRVPTQWDR